MDKSLNNKKCWRETINVNHHADFIRIIKPIMSPCVMIGRPFLQLDYTTVIHMYTTECYSKKYNNTV